MPLSNPFRRTADRPSLRERAAALRASFSPTAPASVALPAPGSEEAIAAFHAACHQDTIRSQGIIDGYPESKRNSLEWWTADSLAKAMETGEIMPAECARLMPRATERELRMAEIHHDLNLGALHALAFANSYPVPAASDTEKEDDAELLALVPLWKAAVSLYQRRMAEEDASERAGTSREGIAAAEDACREAGTALHEIEVRIGDLSALTMAGLRFKARVAKRSADNELDWPDNLGGGLVRDILAIGEPESETDDADLLRLGHLFEAAREREMQANETLNAAQREARQHMLERPAALLFRASDHPLHLRKYHVHPNDLEGIEVTSEDIAWMTRKPCARTVSRPVRSEDNLPADARAVVTSEPWPEAQIRADEIVAAWNAWHAERDATRDRYVLPEVVRESDEAGDATMALAERLAAIPARTADGFRLKLRALTHYRSDVLDAQLEDEPDPDQILSHSIWRDVQGELPEVSQADLPKLTDQIDFASASMEELQALHDTACAVGDFAGAMAWTGRCHTRGQVGRRALAPDFNRAGALMQWLGDALSSVQFEANEEAKRRTPTSSEDREIRWQIIARPVLENGDPAEIAAFVRDLRDYAGQYEDDKATDPVLALIAESHRAEEAAGALDANWRSIPLAERAGREDAMSDRQAKAREAALRTLPTTHEGLKAFADYVGYQASLTYGSDWRAKIKQEMGGDLLVALCAAVETAADA